MGMVLFGRVWTRPRGVSHEPLALTPEPVSTTAPFARLERLIHPSRSLRKMGQIQPFPTRPNHSGTGEANPSRPLYRDGLAGMVGIQTSLPKRHGQLQPFRAPERSFNHSRGPGMVALPHAREWLERFGQSRSGWVTQRWHTLQRRSPSALFLALWRALCAARCARTSAGVLLGVPSLWAHFWPRTGASRRRASASSSASARPPGVSG